jgi:hypothetical protein
MLVFYSRAQSAWSTKRPPVRADRLCKVVSVTLFHHARSCLKISQNRKHEINGNVNVESRERIKRMNQLIRIHLYNKSSPVIRR